MAEQHRRPEPVAKISDYLTVVAPCSRCRNLIRVSFAALAQTQNLSCQGCGQSWSFDLDAEDMRAIDRDFRRLEDPVRDREAWVELRPYP